MTVRKNRFAAKPDPTPQEIWERATEIRRGWSVRERASRRVQAGDPLTIKEVLAMPLRRGHWLDLVH